jgi:tRNA (guanine-N(7)-)-methyltransferase subunit TRM82
LLYRSGKLHLLLGNFTATATTSTPPPATVRCIAFSKCGKFLAAATDDKKTYLWSTYTWERIKTLISPKKISAINFSKDGSLLLAANKFGDVGVTSTAVSEAGLSIDTQFELFLGHYCSVITSLSLSDDGTLLATTDRDGKVRINKMPESSPLQGCHEIQCFGFGHTDFVSCSAFIQQGDDEVLVSGGGDGTLRMWNKMNGAELAMLQLGNTNDNNNTKARPVLAVCPSQDGKHLVVALDGVKELCVVSVDLHGGKLVDNGRCAVPGVPFATDICLDTSTNKFLIASGPLNTTAQAVLACCELNSDSTALSLSTFEEVLHVDAKKQLQKCDEAEMQLDKMAPRKMLPGYLHKRTFVPQDEFIAGRKAPKKEAAAGPSAGAVEEEEES